MLHVDTHEIALQLYNMACDMDYMDYEDLKDETIKEIEDCVYHIYAASQNPYNADYFRTFIKCLETITQNH